VDQLLHLVQRKHLRVTVLRQGTRQGKTKGKPDKR
jgi:hypothetical protein